MNIEQMVREAVKMARVSPNRQPLWILTPNELESLAALVRAQALEEAAAELDHDWPADTIEERTLRKQYAKLIRTLKASPDAGEG